MLTIAKPATIFDREHEWGDLDGFSDGPIDARRRKYTRPSVLARHALEISKERCLGNELAARAIGSHV